jgi:hypothetical protein
MKHSPHLWTPHQLLTLGIWRKFVLYVEGTVYEWISLLEIGKDIMPIKRGREIMATYRCENHPIIEE